MPPQSSEPTAADVAGGHPGRIGHRPARRAHRPERAQRAAAARRAAVPVAAARARTPTAGRWLVLALSGFTDWADGVLARKLEPVQRARRAARPARRPALHPGHARRAGAAPHHPAVAGAGDRRPRPGAAASRCRCCAARGYAPPQVHYLGKAATFCLLYAFPLLLLGAHHGHALGDIARPIAWAFTIWGTGLYLWAGGLYLRAGRRGCVPDDPVRADECARPRTQPRRVTTQQLVDLVLDPRDPGYEAAAAAPRRGPAPRRWYDAAARRGRLPSSSASCSSSAYVHTHRGAPEAAKVHDQLVARVRTAEGHGATISHAPRPRSTNEVERIRNAGAVRLGRAGARPSTATRCSPGSARRARTGRRGDPRRADGERHALRRRRARRTGTDDHRRISSPTVMCAAWSTSCGPTEPRRSR